MEDIAAALASQSRFGGSATHFFSQAQHSISVATLMAEVMPTHALCGLLDGAWKAYLPVPRSIVVCSEDLAEAQDGWEKAILWHFNLPVPGTAEYDRVWAEVQAAKRLSLMVELPTLKKVYRSYPLLDDRVPSSYRFPQILPPAEAATAFYKAANDHAGVYRTWLDTPSGKGEMFNRGESMRELAAELQYRGIIDTFGDTPSDPPELSH